jgi:uncharacterized membrane protein
MDLLAGVGLALPVGLTAVLTGVGLALPAGLNAYIPLLGVAMAEKAGWIQLPQPYSLLGEWWAILLIAVFLCVEILADKVPAVDHVNDMIQTVVRPLAGAFVMLAATGMSWSKSPGFTIALVATGIVLAGGVHAVKAASRPVINGTTGGLGGPVASIVEDVVAVAATVLAIVVPVLSILLIAVVLFFMIRAVVKWRRKKGGPEAGTAPPAPAA